MCQRCVPDICDEDLQNRPEVGIFFFMTSHRAEQSNISASLADSILTTVAYFDHFSYPLTTDQLFFFLPQNSVTPTDVRKEADRLCGEGLLRKFDHFYLLPNGDPDVVRRRTADEARARRMMRMASIIGSVIRHFPFVRAVFLTGSLSKNVSAPAGDIDFMIVTSPDRLWICKAVLTAFRKIVLFGSKKYFCTNYYVTENHYQQQRQNFYTAVEVVTTKPIWNELAFGQFLAANRWVEHFLPNVVVAPAGETADLPRRSAAQRLAERLLNTLPLDRYNITLMNHFHRRWKKIYRHVPEERFRSMFLISPDVSACWPEDRQEPAMTRFRQKLAALGIEYSV